MKRAVSSVITITILFLRSLMEGENKIKYTEYIQIKNNIKYIKNYTNDFL